MMVILQKKFHRLDKDDERYCHIFIKGCSGEDYTGFFQTAGYIEQKTTPVCDSEQYCITNIRATEDVSKTQPYYFCFFTAFLTASVVH